MNAASLARLREAVRRQAEHPSSLASACFLAASLAADPGALPEDHEALATCLAKKGNYAPALAALEKVQARALTAPMRAFRDARETLELKGVRVEDEIASRGETSVALGATGLHLLGQICEAGGHPKDAERYYSMALALDPYLYDARERLAILSASERADMLPGQRAAAEAGDDSLRLLNVLERASALLARYRCDEALGLLLALPPSQMTAYVLHQIGRAYFEKAEFARACEAFAAMRVADPYRVQGLELYSTALWHCKRTVELATLAHDVEQKAPRAPETFCVLGNSFSLEKEHDYALRFFKKACEVDDKFTYAFTLAGHEYVANEDFDKAMTCYRTALRIDPNHYNAWWGLGTIYFRQEKNDLAEQHFRSAIGIHPTSSILWCFLGIVLHAQKREDDALQALERAGRLNPANPQVRFQRAHVLLALGRLPEALVELEAVRDVAPREASVHLMMGNISKQIGQRDKAMYHFVSALDLEPKDAATVRAAIDQLDDTIAERTRVDAMQSSSSSS